MRAVSSGGLGRSPGEWQQGWRGSEAGSGGASKRVCAGEWRRVGAQKGGGAVQRDGVSGTGRGRADEMRVGAGKP
jgi:hypothetical protein